MNMRQGIRFLVARDIWDNGRLQQEAVLAAQDLPADSLPFEAGLRGGIEIHKIQAVTIAKMTGALAIRAAGAAILVGTAEALINGLTG